MAAFGHKESECIGAGGPRQRRRCASEWGILTSFLLKGGELLSCVGCGHHLDITTLSKESTCGKTIVSVAKPWSYVDSLCRHECLLSLLAFLGPLPLPSPNQYTSGQALNTRKSPPGRMYHHNLTLGFCQRAAIEKDISRFPEACRQPFVVVIGVSLVENKARGMDESRNTIIWVTIGDRDSYLTVELAPCLAPKLQDAIVPGMVIHITDFRIFEEYFIWYVTRESFHPQRLGPHHPPDHAGTRSFVDLNRRGHSKAASANWSVRECPPLILKKKP